MPLGKSTVVAVVCVLATIFVVPVSADSTVESLAAPPVRSPIAGENFYFVMTDRYRDGDPSNNTGGISGGLMHTGFEPSSESFYHGGDLVGLTGSCDPADLEDHGLARLKRLGFTAIWITPPFVQRTVQGSSASYHGYWFLDLSKPDPHLGTEAEFAAFVSCAKKLDIKVFLDVVVNHTADVITFRQGYDYVSLKKAPYRTARGKVFDPWNYTSGKSFPQLSRTKSFAKTPSVDKDFINAKYPALLNDVTNYHNRGNISWGSCVGRCEMDGDFSGLDDIMTEDWAVVQALADAYGAWITKYGIDGFRLDTAKHTDPYFFGRWLPLISQSAQSVGKTDFTSFGEVWLTDAAQLAEEMQKRKLPSVLDFPYQDAVRKFASKRATGGSIAALFEEDDYYTSATTNAHGLTTFLGNHDMGRIGYFIKSDSGASGAELTERHLLAHDFLYLTRGVPVVYYGDEVGMIGTGDGKDKRARQDMFPTLVPDWQTQERVSTDPIGTGSSFAESTIIEDRIRSLAQLRAEHPALATGAQITRYGQGDVFVASRIDTTARREYLVAFNAGNDSKVVAVPTATPSSAWSVLSDSSSGLASDAGGVITVDLPARSSVVLRAESLLPAPSAVTARLAVNQDYITGKYEVSATVTGTDPVTVAFLKKTAQGWVNIGTDEAPPYRVFTAPSRTGTTQFAAVVTNTAGVKTSTVSKRMTIKPFL